jgi:pimeloyl-ACP methyl ester carboxylesterase
LRSLAIHLATDGYVSLRFDHFGTGDSSGSTDDDELDEAWVEGVSQGVALLRSLGVTSVSAVGMRMGATIVGTAAAAYDLGLSSFAMWDPCETGRTYVREIEALGALRRVITTESSEPTKMLEYALSDDAESRLNRFTIREPSSKALAERVLVIVRDDRAVSSKFRARWGSENVDWFTTSEQGPLLEAQIPTSLLPVETIAKLRVWLTATPSIPTSFSDPPRSRDAIVAKGSDAFAVRESVVELGSHKMFGVMSEPVGEVRGPLVVMVNGVNEDHIGPARLWVELSRRWAALGFRCIRFDLRELGESPWLPGQPDRATYDKTRPQDIEDAVRTINPANSSDAVLVGYCSGGQLAIEAALNLKARGVCAINPQIAPGVFRSVDRVKKFDRGSVLSFAKGVENALRRRRLVDKTLRKIARELISFAHPPNVRPALEKSRTETLLLLSPDDLSPLRRLPILRRRMTSTEHFRVEIVPTMDHAILSTLGRERAVAFLSQYIIETYVGDSPLSHAD